MQQVPMLEPWNVASILPPPVNMFLCDKKVDISAIKHVFNNIVKVLSKQSPLHKESALCSRFLYKYDRKFSNDIGYRNLRKVYTALKKYLALNLLKDVESFLSALPSENDDEKYLPTRQMLEYVMLRIVSFSKIMLRICICSKQSAIFYLNRLKRGESYWMSLLPYALLSRLWSITMVLVQHSTTWYSNLYPFLNILESKGVKFLPETYELPQDLEQWLDLINVDCFGRFQWDQKKIMDIDTVLEEDENDTLESILSFVSELNKNEIAEEVDEEFKPLLNVCQGELNSRTSTQIDYGVVLSRDSFTMNNREMSNTKSIQMDRGEHISRDSFKALNTNDKLSKENYQVSHEPVKTVSKQHVDNDIQQNDSIERNDHTHLNVTNFESLKTFIKTEERFRNESNAKSLTSHLSLMQWHALKKASLNLCDTLANRKISKKFLRIWKEKCLEYK